MGPTIEPESIETKVKDLENNEPEIESDASTPRPKRKIISKQDTNEFLYFKPNERADDNFLQHYIPQKTRIKPTLKHDVSKHIIPEPKTKSFDANVENKSIFLPDIKEEMTVSERLKQFMKKAVF